MDDAARIAVETVRVMADEIGETVQEVFFVPYGDQAEDVFHRTMEL